MNNDFLLIRYNTDGSLDASFGTAGILQMNIGGANETDDYVLAVALQSDGKIVAAGPSSTGIGWNNFVVARFLTDGTLVSVSYDGVNFNLSVDGVFVATLPATGTPFGTAGFQAKNTTGTFADIFVTP